MFHSSFYLVAFFFLLLMAISTLAAPNQGHHPSPHRQQTGRTRRGNFIAGLVANYMANNNAYYNYYGRHAGYYGYGQHGYDFGHGNRVLYDPFNNGYLVRHHYFH